MINRKFFILVLVSFSFSLILLLFHLQIEVNDLQKKLNSASPSEVNYNAVNFMQNDFDEERLVIIYNRVPKTGSTSFIGLAYSLCSHNQYNVIHINTSKNSNTLSLSDQIRFVQNITNWNEKKPALYHGHIAFLDFSRYGILRKPLYINVIRKPMDRLVSYFYFLRYGDDYRPYLVRRRQGDKMTLDECVEKQHPDCSLQHLWVQVPFFCGQHSECWIPGSTWALEQAKHNLVNHYFLVGITEELQDFVALLEHSLPRFFRGALNLYVNGTKSHLRKTMKKIPPSPETVAKLQKTKVWRLENEFYNFALEQFHFVKKKTVYNDPFTRQLRVYKTAINFEKIRPIKLKHT